MFTPDVLPSSVKQDLASMRFNISFRFLNLDTKDDRNPLPTEAFI